MSRPCPDHVPIPARSWPDRPCPLRLDFPILPNPDRPIATAGDLDGMGPEEAMLMMAALDGGGMGAGGMAGLMGNDSWLRVEPIKHGRFPI